MMQFVVMQFGGDFFIIKFKLTYICWVAIGVIFPPVKNVAFFTKGLLKSFCGGFLGPLGRRIVVYIDHNDFRIRV